MNSLFVPLIKGLFTGGGLIIAIGAQNAFVLKQGLLKNQVFATALFCILGDALLIGLGVGGMGVVFTSSEWLLFLSKWGGIAFLAWYGYRAFRSAFSKSQILNAAGLERPSLKETFLVVAAVTFLNPHAYLDTFVLLGSIGSQFEEAARPYFALGAILASVFWFFGLSYGARLLAPLFQKPKAWKVLDFLVGCSMLFIALSLLIG